MRPFSTRLISLSLLLAFAFIGCKGKPDSDADATSEQQPSKLNLLILDDPELADAIRRQWSERGDGELNISEGVSDELLQADRPVINADAVIYPTGMIGKLIESNLIVPLPGTTIRDPNLAWSDIFDLVRLREATWDRKAYAIPLGSPQLALFYRRDVWEKLQLKPPATWEQYTNAIPIINEAAAKDGSLGIEFASAEPLAPGWAGQTLLARSAAYARHRNYLSALFDLESMQPLIDGPPFVRALDELAAANRGTSALEWDAQHTVQLLTTGKASAAIGYPSSGLSSGEEPEPTNTIGVAELPGAEASYDRERQTWDARDGNDVHVTLLMSVGRSASVTRRANNQQAAANLLVWIAGKEWSSGLVSKSPNVMLYRRQHLEKPEQWITRPALADTVRREYATVAARSLDRSDSVMSVRIPGRDQYMAALDLAVARVVRGEVSSSEALQEAAAKWNEITDQIGREKQKAAYRKSLGV